MPRTRGLTTPAPNALLFATRAALLTGYYAQQVRRDVLPGHCGGGVTVRPEWAPLLPDLLEPAGYRSYHSGRWHIKKDLPAVVLPVADAPEFAPIAASC